MQLKKGSTLAEVFASAQRKGGTVGEPSASDPLRAQGVRSPSELQAVIDDAGIGYEDCGKLSVSLDWWNRDTNDADWQLAMKEAGPS
jgi:hypothetical protein